MKINTVICDSKGQRMVTSTKEVLRIRACDAQPGDVFMSPRHRVLRPEWPITKVDVRNGFAYLHSPLKEPLQMLADSMVDVERTT